MSMQAALKAEITEFLGRDRYQRAAACEDARAGSRNGYREVTVKTTAGRSLWPARSCAVPARRSRRGCSAAM
jgi:Transposase, Mutator family